MNIEFNTIYVTLIEIGAQLREMPIGKDFFQKVEIYKNFFSQMMQILNGENININDYKEKLKVIENNNIFIEDRLRKEKSEIKSEIMKENLKEKIKNKYK